MARTLCVDTRQKEGQHDLKNARWESLGIPTIRSKLPFGDYAWVPTRAVDTKKDVYELHCDIVSQHARFRAECEGARDAGCELTVLVENRHGIRSLDDLAGWDEPVVHFAKRKNAKRRIRGRTLAAQCRTMSVKYGVRFLFCAP